MLSLTHKVCVVLLCAMVGVSRLPAMAAATTTPREVSCDGTSKVIPPGALNLYNLGVGNDTLNFDTLAIFGGVSLQMVDLGEFWNALRMVSDRVNPILSRPGATVAEVAALWNHTWAELGAELLREAAYYEAYGDDIVSAASAYLRASSYLQLAGRFDNLTSKESLRIFESSVQAFQRGLQLGSPAAPPCVPQQFPMWYGPQQRVIQLHGYYCATPVQAPSAAPTVVVLNGFDGTAEMTLQQSAFLLNYGFNLVIFDGPGQGYTVRRTNATFIVDFENATSAVVDFALAHLNVSADNLFVMGYSFGGFLAPRSFLFDSRFKGLIANGGVSDFYQATICQLPPSLRNLFVHGGDQGRALFNQYLNSGLPDSFALHFLQQYGGLGFGVQTFSDLYLAFQAYAFSADDLARLSNRSVFVYDPAWDTLTGNQSQIFFARAGAATSATGGLGPHSVLQHLNPYRGVGLHCAVGSTANMNIIVGRWIYTVTYNFDSTRKRPTTSEGREVERGKGVGLV